MLIGSSCKMHLSVDEVRDWLRGCAHLLSDVQDADVFLLPPFVCLPMASEELRGTRIAYGAQNMHWEARGAFTGEVSPTMIAAFGGTFVELGHAERRRHFGETDDTVNLKVRSALRHDLRPIVCVGEPARAPARADDTVPAQVRHALSWFLTYCLNLENVNVIGSNFSLPERLSTFIASMNRIRGQRTSLGPLHSCLTAFFHQVPELTSPYGTGSSETVHSSVGIL